MSLFRNPMYPGNDELSWDVTSEAEKSEAKDAPQEVPKPVESETKTAPVDVSRPEEPVKADPDRREALRAAKARRGDLVRQEGLQGKVEFNPAVRTLKRLANRAAVAVGSRDEEAKAAVGDAENITSPNAAQAAEYLDWHKGSDQERKADTFRVGEYGSEEVNNVVNDLAVNYGRTIEKLTRDSLARDGAFIKNLDQTEQSFNYFREVGDDSNRVFVTVINSGTDQAEMVVRQERLPEGSVGDTREVMIARILPASGSLSILVRHEAYDLFKQEYEPDDREDFLIVEPGKEVNSSLPVRETFSELVGALQVYDQEVLEEDQELYGSSNRVEEAAVIEPEKAEFEKVKDTFAVLGAVLDEAGANSEVRSVNGGRVEVKRIDEGLIMLLHDKQMGEVDIREGVAVTDQGKLTLTTEIAGASEPIIETLSPDKEENTMTDHVDRKLEYVESLTRGFLESRNP